MPAVLLKSRPEFGYVRTEPGADIAGLVGELRSRQNDAGAYKLWPGSDEVVEFVSLYAQHLLLEAAERDEAVPGDLIASGNGYLRSVAARDGNNLTDERQTAYAIYLLTRQGQRMSTEIAAARKRLEERYRGQWEQDLTAAWLAAALDLMRQDRDAGQLIGRTRFGVGTSSDTYNDPMTRDALLLFVMARHFPERLRDVPQRNARDARAACERQLLPFVVGRYDAAGARRVLERDAGRGTQSLARRSAEGQTRAGARPCRCDCSRKLSSASRQPRCAS